MKILPLLFLPLLIASADAQNFWIGNSAGTANAWSTSTNWSAGHTPSGGENIGFDGSQTLNTTTKVPTDMTVSINCDVRDVFFQNGFNPTNTTAIGSSSATAKVITVETGSTFVNNATSGTVTFQPFNGGAGALSLALNGTALFGANGGGTLSLQLAITNGSGNGVVSIGSSSGTVILGNTNTYSGGTTLQSGIIQATHDGAFGSGNISLMAGSITLTLSGGASNNYIADGATLNVATGNVINLNYTGTDVVGSLIVNGVAKGPGVYNSSNVPQFTGSGSITVVPEPSTWLTLSLGGALLLVGTRLRRRTS